MDKIYLDNKQIKLSEFDQNILNRISWSYKNFNTHEEIALELKDKKPQYE